MSEAALLPGRVWDDDYAPPDLGCLRALRDCGAIRAHVDHAGYLSLWDNCDADAMPVPGRRDVLDYRLTDAGRRAAERYLK